MLERDKNIQGFTLSELLLAIAVILVLALIAIPSIINVQRNMHMVELNAAAGQIATAAQGQMTAMKVSGTWVALLEDVSEGDIDTLPEAIGLPSTGGSPAIDPDDISYFTADQARDNGIIPQNALDDTVRDGDFIIEYSKSTATVCGVFYSDRKEGFFGTATSVGNPAEAYYQENLDASKREESARMEASPPIGYYWGTPAGATNTVALANPVIWISDDGKLCIQNTNLSSHPGWNTTLTVTITNQEEGKTGSFVIAGLQGSESSGAFLYSAGATADALKAYSNVDDATKIFELAARTTGATNPKDVFQIDINVLAASSNVDLAALANGFAVEDNLKIEAKVTTEQRPAVPATAIAYAEWPKPLAKLRVLVTNPNPDITATLNEAITGTFTAPEVEFVEPLAESLLSRVDDNETIAITSTPATVLANDTEAGGQSYSGAWVDLVATSAIEAKVRATVGSYTSEADAHFYQIYEIWVNDILLGAYNGENEWRWISDSTALPSYLILQDASGQSMDTVTDQTRSVVIDSAALQASELVPDDTGTYTIYVRTAPAIKEVQDYFSTQSRLSAVASATNSVQSVTARSSTGVSLQTDFMSEFGASSSVALWSAKQANAAVVEGQGFSSDDIYVYYAPTPYNPTASTASGSSLSTAALWRFSYDDGSYTRDSYTAFGQNFTGDSRLGDRLARPQILQEGSADFAIPTTADQLFYRTITYYDDEGTLLAGYIQQWVPYYGIDLDNGATNVGETLQEGVDKSTSETFDSWNDEQDGLGNDYPSNALIADYADVMPLYNVRLYAQYTQAIIPDLGMVYLEFYDDGSTGVYGYIGTTLIDTLDYGYESSRDITSWEYRVIVPVGLNKIPYISTNGQADYYNRREPVARGTIVVQGNEYESYYIQQEDWNLNFQNKQGKYATSYVGFIEYVAENPYYSRPVLAGGYTYSFNLLFAASVTPDLNVADKWGNEVPWNVRHTDQLIGRIPQENWIQVQYQTASFLQTYDIDLAYQRKELTMAFNGIYDGGGYAIKNFRVDRGAWSYTAQAGLYPAATDAVFKNIRLIDVDQATSASDWLVDTGSQALDMGLLVGKATRCTFSNCTVEGAVDPSAPLSIFIKTPSGNGEYNIGGLVGVADNCTITDCRTSNIGFSLTTTFESWDGISQNMGGLVGKLSNSNSKITKTSTFPTGALLAKDISFTVSTNQITPQTYAGGLVGTMSSNAMLPTAPETTYQNIGLTLNGTYNAITVPAGRIQ